MTREAPPPGTVLGERYRVIRQLGAGAFGSVLEVEHIHTKHHRAMKVLHPDAAKNPEVVERFLREASAAGRIGNPHIVETFDAGRFADGSPYLVMELLEGETLRTLLHRERQLSPGMACELLGQAALGIHAAHLAGIVHRDLKPENLFVLPGPKVKILDFGVSRFSDPNDLSITQSNVAMGTPLYMSPEQFRGAKDVSATADVYSLGVVLYELLCGSPPFHAETLGALAIQISTTLPPPLSTRVAGLSPELEPVIARAMAREPGDRFATAEAFAHALEPFRNTVDTAPLPQLQVVPVTAATPDEPTYRPPVKATPMAQEPATAQPQTAQEVPRPSAGRWAPLLVAGALLCAGGIWLMKRGPAPIVAAPGPILVLDAAGKDDWRSALAAEVIQRQLSLSPGVQLIPLADAERFRREHEWPSTGPTGKEIETARQQLGVGRVLVVTATGEVQVDGFLSAKTAAAELHRVVPITKNNVTDSALAMARDLRAMLELKVPDTTEDEQFATGLPHEVSLLYAEGRHQLEELNLKGAIDTLGRARGREPANPLVLDALAAAYDAAGYDELALKTAAEAAFAAATVGPRTLALRTECRQRGLEHDLKALRLSCGALLTSGGDLEARLLYANGLSRLERWDDLDGLLVGASAEEQQSPALWQQRARAFGQRGDFTHQRTAGEKLIELGKARQSPSFEASGHFAVCEAKRALGEPHEAANECDRALTQFYSVGDLVGQARAHTELGHIAQAAAGMPALSKLAGSPAEEYEKAREAAHKAGSARDEIASEMHLASLAREAGDLEHAREQLATAESEAAAAGNGELSSRIAAELGETDARRGDQTKAAAAYARSIEAASHAGLPALEGFALMKAGRLDWQRGQLNAAGDELERATRLLKGAGAQDDRAFAAAYLADVLADHGDLAGARAQLAQARALWDYAPSQQAWADADLLRYAFEAGEPVDVKAAAAVVERFKNGATADATGHAMALALRALAEPAAAPKWIAESQRALAQETEPDPDTKTWVELASAEALTRAGQKPAALKLLATSKQQPTKLKRLSLWSDLLTARVSGNAAAVARVAAEAKQLGYLALANRAEKKK
ncbi:MAG: protein kinase [Myxococcaceae bacterium]